MSTDIVESIDLSLFIPNKKELEACLLKLDPRAWLCESELVRCEDPFLSKDSPSFKLVYFWRSIPRSRQSSCCRSGVFEKCGDGIFMGSGL